MLKTGCLVDMAFGRREISEVVVNGLVDLTLTSVSVCEEFGSYCVKLVIGDLFQIRLVVSD
jgi:hypothetical protein